MKNIVSLALVTLIAGSCLSMAACDKAKDVPGVDSVTSVAQGLGDTVNKWGSTAKDWADAGISNIKDSALSQINSEVDKFMEENNIPKDKVDEVMGLAKDWAKTALTASGEIDKAKWSLKEYLAEHLDDLDVSSSSKK